MSFLPIILVKEVRSTPETLRSKPFITNKDKQERIEKNSRDKKLFMYKWQRTLSRLKATYSTQSLLEDWYTQLLDNK